jgi:hypothetical protein
VVVAVAAAAGEQYSAARCVTGGTGRHGARRHLRVDEVLAILEPGGEALAQSESLIRVSDPDPSRPSGTGIQRIWAAQSNHPSESLIRVMIRCETSVPVDT